MRIDRPAAAIGPHALNGPAVYEDGNQATAMWRSAPPSAEALGSSETKEGWSPDGLRSATYEGLTFEDLPADMRDKLLQDGESPHENFASYDYLSRPVGMPLSPVLESSRGQASCTDVVEMNADAGSDAAIKQEAHGSTTASKVKEYKCKRCGASKRSHVCTGATDSEGSRDAALNNRKEWAMREDQLIWQGVQQIGCKWRQIAAMLPGRSDDAVRNRYNRLKEAEASGLVRSESGEPTEVPTTGTYGGGGGTGTYRCSKCGQLKKNHVCTAVTSGEARPKPDDKRRPERVGWTKAEDAIITHSVQELGHRWYQIAERLPGRTDHAIRNRWHRLLTMRQEKQQRQDASGAAASSSQQPTTLAADATADAADDLVRLTSGEVNGGADQGEGEGGGCGEEGLGVIFGTAMRGRTTASNVRDCCASMETEEEVTTVSFQDSPCEPLADSGEPTPTELREL